MALIDVERAVLSVCFGAQPPEAALAMLGDREHWLLYRELTRDRLWREIHVALPRTCAAVGAEAMSQTFIAHLDRDPPRTRYFREIVKSFANSTQRIWPERVAVPAFAHDLVRYEAAVWEVSDLEATLPHEVVEFAFDRVPVVSPVLRLLELEWAVNRSSASGEYAAGPCFVGVHRGAADARPRTWSFNRTTFALLADFQRAEVCATESVQRVAAQLGRKVTPKFVERLCESLAQWIDVGILLGSR